MRILSVSAAGCRDHADVVLACTATGAKSRVRVDAWSGRAILAETNGIPSEHATFVDLLRAVLDANGCRLSRVEISGGAEPRGFIYFDQAAKVTGIRGLPPAVPLIIAARLGLPICRAAEGEPAPARAAHGDALPPAIQQFLDQLPLDGVGEA